MLRLFVATFLLVSANCCVPFIFPAPPPTTFTLDVCKGALSPAATVSPVSLAKCIAEQPAVVVTLLASLTSGGDPAAYLQANGQAVAATALRTCMAKELGLVNADGTFNMAKLKELLLAKVSGAAYAGNTQLGLDKCPAVVGFNVQDYLLCVISYCTTGTAPIIAQ